MISIIWSYWQRQIATDVALASLVRCYPHLDLEVVIVDDGSPVPYIKPFDTPWPVHIVRLPTKHVALDPCVPINAGVWHARGELIALSGAEILHPNPVLMDLQHVVDKCGPDMYVTAACRLQGTDVWHAHSSIRPTVEGIEMPLGSHFHFLALLHRDLWDKAGGFDPDYRNGAGYDDPDWLLRLQRAGARFMMRDHQIVHHQRQDARADWPKGAHERNRQLFRSKWCN